MVPLCCKTPYDPTKIDARRIIIPFLNVIRFVEPKCILRPRYNEIKLIAGPRRICVCGVTLTAGNRPSSTKQYNVVGVESSADKFRRQLRTEFARQARAAKYKDIIVKW